MISFVWCVTIADQHHEGNQEGDRMNRFVTSLPMPSRRKQLGSEGKRILVEGLKFVGTVLALFIGGYLLLVGWLSL